MMMADRFEALQYKLQILEKDYLSDYDKEEVYYSLPNRKMLYSDMKLIEDYPRYKATLLDIINCLRQALATHFAGDGIYDSFCSRNIKELVSEFCTYYGLDPRVEGDLSYVQHSAPQQVVKEVQDTKTIAELLRQIQQLQEENKSLKQELAKNRVNVNNDEQDEIIVAELMPFFNNNKGWATMYLHRIKGVSDVRITEITNELIKKGELPKSNQCKKPLWELLKKYDLYKADKPNWNQQIDIN